MNRSRETARALPCITTLVSRVVDHVANGLTSALLFRTLARGLHFALVPSGLSSAGNLSGTNSEALAVSTPKEQGHAFRECQGQLFLRSIRIPSKLSQEGSQPYI